jgi:predicted NUDIX family NTP pyrophosphohydrolase
MASRLFRSIQEPIRENLTWDEMWMGPDRGLIWCWEKGRLDRHSQPELARRAERGELIPLDWKGGVRKKLKEEIKRGTLKYLATWQGLRGEDLDIDIDGERVLVCCRTGQKVLFSAAPIEDDD